jgi:hypothetical protein
MEKIEELEKASEKDPISSNIGTVRAGFLGGRRGPQGAARGPHHYICK